MFFNLSNHPSSSWIKEEKEAASKWGDIVDIAFPKNDVLADENEILEIAKNFLKSLKMTPKDAILVVGEYSLAFAIIDELLHQGVTVLTTISNSIVAFRTNENGIQERSIRFIFSEFVPYQRYAKAVSPVTKTRNVVLNCNANFLSEKWDERIKFEISNFGKIEDYPITGFAPKDLNPQNGIVEKILSDIDAIAPNAIILAGTFFSFFLLSDVLVRKGYNVYIMRNERLSTEKNNPDGTSTKVSELIFRGLRKLTRFNWRT